MVSPVLFSSLSVDWRTPKKLYEKLNNEFHFNDDPCPVGGKNGLIRDWGTCTYVNPPYGRNVVKWIKKGYEESLKNKLVVMLLPARTDTKWFHNYVLPYAKEIRFIKGRLRFNDYKENAPFPSMIIVFKKAD